MSYFIRKIDKAKWNKTDPNTSDIAADAITNCLNTKQNQLSFWRSEKNDAQSINEILKAIISSFTSGIESFDIIIFEESELPSSIGYEKTIPATKYTAINDNHYDFINLTLSKLTLLAQLIYSKVKEGKEKRVMKMEAKNLIKEIIINDPSFRDKLPSIITDNLN